MGVSLQILGCCVVVRTGCCCVQGPAFPYWCLLIIFSLTTLVLHCVCDCTVPTLLHFLSNALSGHHWLAAYCASVTMLVPGDTERGG